MSEFALSILQNIPAVIMLVIGFALVVFEMYIPGFGAPGIIGIILLVVGVIATNPTPLQALVLALIIVVLLCIAFSICIRTVSKGRLNKTPLVLTDVATGSSKDEKEDDLSYFVGRTGETHTLLRPAGIAEFDGVKLNVVSDGDFIDVGRQVRVERVEGNRIVVREVAEKKA